MSIKYEISLSDEDTFLLWDPHWKVCSHYRHRCYLIPFSSPASSGPICKWRWTSCDMHIVYVTRTFSIAWRKIFRIADAFLQDSAEVRLDRHAKRFKRDPFVMRSSSLYYCIWLVIRIHTSRPRNCNITWSLLRMSFLDEIKSEQTTTSFLINCGLLRE